MNNLASIIDIAPRPGHLPMFVTEDGVDMFTTMANRWRVAFPNVRPQANLSLPWLPIMVMWHEQTTLPNVTAFPNVMVFEDSSVTDMSTLDSSRQENHRIIVWGIEVFSNLLPGAAMQAKNIMDFNHPLMEKYGWVRTSHGMVRNHNMGANVTWLSARYRIKMDRRGFGYQ